MPFEDAGPPIKAESVTQRDAPPSIPIAEGTPSGGGGVAGGPVPLGNPYDFPFWAIF